MIKKISLFLLLFYTTGICQICNNQMQIKSPYALDLTREVVLLGGGAAMSIGGLVLMKHITPFTALELAALDPAKVNGFDRPAIGGYREDLNGDLLLYTSFLLPLSFLANEHTKRDWQTLGVIGAEVLLLQSGLNAIIKSTVLRTRPYAYDPAAPMDKKTDTDARVSFYSGHTATTAALAFYVARVFSDYLEDKTAKTLIWTAAAVYPAVVSYLRVDSGHHFRTDVMTGYAVGALLGYFIPELHKSVNQHQLSAHYRFAANFTGISLIYKF